MADLVPAGQLRDLDLTERVEAELEILGFELSQHVLDFYADLLAGLGVVRSADLPARENGETVLVAGAKVATQTPAVRSGQRIIFASLDDAAGLVDLAFFESVQDRCAARLFASWLLLVRGKVRRAGAGPMAVTVNATECWDIPALEEIRLASGMEGVRAALATGDVGLGRLTCPPPRHALLPGPPPLRAGREPRGSPATAPARSSSPTALPFPRTPRPADRAAASSTRPAPSGTRAPAARPPQARYRTTMEFLKRPQRATTARCIPLDGPPESGPCIRCDLPSAYEKRVTFGRAY